MTANQDHPRQSGYINTARSLRLGCDQPVQARRQSLSGSPNARDGDQSVNCMFRGVEETKCAGGWCMSDGEYWPHMEGRAWTALAKENIVPHAHAGLIDNLQTIHDSYQPYQWPEG